MVSTSLLQLPGAPGTAKGNTLEDMDLLLTVGRGLMLRIGMTSSIGTVRIGASSCVDGVERVEKIDGI